MRIREGDPLEIYTSKEGEVIFKKYSLLGDLDDFAAQMCDTMNKSTGFTVAITDRDTIIAVAGAFRKELIGKGIWKEAGVYAPEYFDPEPYMQLMDESGYEYKILEINA